MGLESWLEQTAELRKTLEIYGKSPISTDIGERQNDMDIAIQHADDAGRLRADCQSFLTQGTAQAVLKWSKQDEFTYEDRKALVRQDVNNLKRLLDGMKITEGLIKIRIYVLMNLNRSR